MLNRNERKVLELHKLSIDNDKRLNLSKALIKAKELGFQRILLESGKTMTVSFLRKNLVDDLNIFVSNNYLGKNGSGSIKSDLNKFLKNKKNYKEKVNLFGEKLLIYKIK